MDFSQLSRRQLEALLEAYAHQLVATDGYWFMAVEDWLGHEEAYQMDINVWEQAGPQEARRVARALGIDPRQSLDAALEVLRLCPTWVNFAPKATKLGENKALFTCTDCMVQKNRIKMGRPEFQCKRVAQVLIKAYARGLNPELKASCLLAPPDPHTPDIWCQYEIEG